MFAFCGFFMSFLYVLLHVLAFSCELLFFYIPPPHFSLFFSLFYTSMVFLVLYISHALSYFFIYVIVSVIFYIRKRPLRLRLLFLCIQHYFCFLLLLPFLILPNLCFCFLLCLPFLFFSYKRFISSLFSPK